MATSLDKRDGRKALVEIGMEVFMHIKCVKRSIQSAKVGAKREATFGSGHQGKEIGEIRMVKG